MESNSVTVNYSKGQGTQPISSQPTSQINLVVQPESEWSSGLFECCQDPLSAAVACCLFPCYTCYLSNKLGESVCVACCVPGGLVTFRSMARVRHNIPGSVMGDCCTVCWCPCCAVTQLERHHDTNQY